MLMQKPLTCFALLCLAACGATEGPAANASASSENGAAAADDPAATEAVAAKPVSTPAPVLAADGIEPNIRFGMKREEAVAAAAAAFGTPGKPQHNDECGEGPMDFVPFGGLQLAFQDGKLAGWALSDSKPALRTKSGLTVGSPRSALGGLEIDEESSLGPEFEDKGVGGVLDEKGETVIALWAGDTCQFR